MTTFQTDTHFISISYVALILSANLSKARLINDESDSIFDSDLDLFSDDKSDSVTDSDFPNTTRWSFGGALLYSGSLRERIKMMHHEDTIVPRNFDSRKRWPKCKSIGTIWDQGQCGSCWALSSAMMMTDRTCIASNGSVKFEYSAEDLLTCCSYCVPSSKSNTCQRGGIVYYAVKYWIEEGVVSGGHVGSGRGCKPYRTATFEGTSSGCRKTCRNQDYPVSYYRDKHFGVDVTEFRYPMKMKHLQTEIMTNGPVVTVMKATAHFEAKYRDGVYIHQKNVKIKGTWHAVRIIGWGFESGIPYWLVANTWGKNWGKLGGFFKILRGRNHLWIEKSVIAGHLKKVSPPRLPFYSSSRTDKVSKNVIVCVCVIGLIRLNFHSTH